MGQDRWADNTGTDIRQGGGIASENLWAPTTNEEEQSLQNTRTMPGPASDFTIVADMDDLT